MTVPVLVRAYAFWPQRCKSTLASCIGHVWKENIFSIYTNVNWFRSVKYECANSNEKPFFNGIDFSVKAASAKWNFK